MFDKYKNNLIVDNFLTDKNLESNFSDVLLQTADGEVLTLENYSKYKQELSSDEINSETKEKVFNKFIEKFLTGNLAISQVKTVLLSIGVNNLNITESNDDYAITVEYGESIYLLNCVKNAAEKGNDNKTVTYYSKDVLLNNFTEEEINTYFLSVEIKNKEVSKYVLNQDLEFNTLEELINSLKAKKEENKVIDKETEVQNAIQDLRNKILENPISNQSYVKYFEKFKDESINIIMLKFGYTESFANFLFKKISCSFYKAEINNENYIEVFIKSIENLEFLTNYSDSDAISLCMGVGKFYDYSKDTLGSLFRAIGYHLLPKGEFERSQFDDLVTKSLLECLNIQDCSYTDVPVISFNELKDIDTNGDGIFWDELYAKIEEKMLNYIPNEMLQFNNYINPDVLLCDKNEISGKDILDNYYNMVTSNDYSKRFFARLSSKAYKIFNTDNEADALNTINLFIRILNSKLGVPNNSTTITKETINKLNEQNDIEALVDSILSSEEYRDAIYLGLDGEISDYFGQGGTGDCWFIASIISMKSSKIADKLLQEAITLNPDNSITVHFKGVYNEKNADMGIDITISAEAIIEASGYHEYSWGDNDVLALELAMQVIRSKGKNELIWESGTITKDYLIEAEDCDAEIVGGQILEGVEEILGFTSESYTLKSNNYIEILKNLDTKVGKENLVIGFALRPNYVTCTTINGINFSFGGDNGGPHAFSIVGFTDNTVTIVNPWWTTRFEISWGDFWRMNPYDVNVIAIC